MLSHPQPVGGREGNNSQKAEIGNHIQHEGSKKRARKDDN